MGPSPDTKLLAGVDPFCVSCNGEYIRCYSSLWGPNIYTNNCAMTFGFAVPRTPILAFWVLVLPHASFPKIQATWVNAGNPVFGGFRRKSRLAKGDKSKWGPVTRNALRPLPYLEASFFWPGLCRHTLKGRVSQSLAAGLNYHKTRP